MGSKVGNGIIKNKMFYSWNTACRLNVKYTEKSTEIRRKIFQSIRIRSAHSCDYIAVIYKYNIMYICRDDDYSMFVYISVTTRTWKRKEKCN